jgi:hypothetical protein
MANAYYSAAFNLSNLHALNPLGTMTLATAGESNIVITLASLTGTDANSASTQWFWHLAETAGWAVIGSDQYATQRFPHYATFSFATTLGAALNAAAIVATWPGEFLVEWTETTLPHYRITYDDGLTDFTYTFSTAAGQRLIGGQAGPLGPVGTSAAQPVHEMGFAQHVVALSSALVTEAPTKTIVTDELNGFDYEPGGIASLVHGDTGIGYGNARLVSPVYRNWRHGYCSKTIVQGTHDPALVSWSFRDLFRHCRSRIPFYVAHGGFGSEEEFEVFMFRDDGNFFVPKPHSLANHVHIDIDFRTVLVGHLEALA